MQSGSPFTIKDLLSVRDVRKKEDCIDPEELNHPEVRTYSEAAWLIDKAIRRLDAPHIYVSEPPRLAKRADALLWEISFDLVVTDLTNRGASVIDPTLLRSILRDIPIHFKETRGVISLADPFLQELINERLVDVIYMPQHAAHEEHGKVIKEMIKVSRNRGQIMHETGHIEEEPPHYIWTKLYPLVPRHEITRQIFRRRPIP